MAATTTPTEAASDPTAELPWHDRDSTVERGRVADAAGDRAYRRASARDPTSRPSRARAASRSAPIRPACRGARRTPDAARGAPPQRPPQRPAPRARGTPTAATCRCAIAVGLRPRRGVPRRCRCGARPRVVADRRSCLGLAAVEFFDKVTEKGYRPAVARGHRRLRRRAAGRLLGRRRRAAARGRVRVHGRRRSGSSAPAASRPARCRTWPITTLGVVWIGAARFVRGVDPALLDRSARRTTVQRHRHAVPGRRWAWSPTTSARCSSARPSARRRCGRGSARTRRSRACIGGTLLTLVGACSSSGSASCSDTWVAAAATCSLLGDRDRRSWRRSATSPRACSSATST